MYQQRLPVQGPEAGELVLRLRLGAGRGRGRIRRTRSRRPSTSAFPLDAAERGRAGQRLRHRRAAREDRLRGDLDHHAVDHSRQPGAQRASRVRLRTGRDAARPADPGRRTARAGAGSATASKARCSAPARARRWNAWCSAIRSTTAPRRCISATTSRSTPAPASCIARRPTAWKTSIPASTHGMKNDEILTRCRATAASPRACPSSAA